MTEKSFSQIKKAICDEDPFAITLFGLYLLDNANTQTDINNGINYLQFAGRSRNCIWAKNVISFLAKNGDVGQPVSEKVLVETYAFEQLRRYADNGNIWAMTALGQLLYTRNSNLIKKAQGENYLKIAASRGCSFAEEMISDYGIIR